MRQGYNQGGRACQRQLAPGLERGHLELLEDVWPRLPGNSIPTGYGILVGGERACKERIGGKHMGKGVEVWRNERGACLGLTTLGRRSQGGRPHCPRRHRLFWYFC